MMRFHNPEALLLLIVLPLFYLYWRNRNTPAPTFFSLALPPSVRKQNPVNYLLILRYLAMICLIIAFARPQSSFKQTQRSISGVDILLLLDVSDSMNVIDLSERPRMDIAKDTLQNFVEGRQNDRIGLVAFSGEPVTLAPLTLDYGLVIQAIRQASRGLIQAGTAIGDGLALALTRLKASSAKSKVIILLTDGDNNVGKIDPSTAGDVAQGYGIKIYSVLIGREGQVRVPIDTLDIFGNRRRTYQIQDNALNPDLVREVAEKSGGKFYRVEDENTLNKVFSEIDKLEKTEIKSTEKTRYEEKFFNFLLMGMVLLLIERILGLLFWKGVVV